MNSSTPTVRPETDFLRGRRALLVDDDPQFLAFLKHLLNKNGVECLEAADAREGLKLLTTETVDVILSDIDMPEMDGYQFLSAVRQQPALETLPFILLTGKPAYSGLLSGMRQGADSYLPKPFGEKDILETIKICFVRRQRLEEQASTRFDEQRENVLRMLPHELRTPLAGILGVADLLESGSASGNDLPEYGEFLRVAGERMLRLTTNFSLCAELQMQNSHLHGKSALFGDHLQVDTQETAQVLELCAQSHNRVDDLRAQITPARVAVPPEAHSKVLNEILDNAFKFSSPGDPVTVTGEISGDLYCWRVEDRGRNGDIASLLQSPELFVQFNRKKQEQQGAGLGLYLAKEICSNFGGTLNFLSSEGGGIIVEIRLPLVAEYSS